MKEDVTESLSSDVLLAHVAKIAASYVSKNKIEPEAIPALLMTIHEGLKATLMYAQDKTANKPVPAVSIKDSLSEDVIICLEDGLSFQSLKRHLRVKYNLSPDEYREKWGLPPDYPMVAPAYAKRRSELAKRTGLGRHKN